MDFEAFTKHLATQGIIRQGNGDAERISQIFTDIDENDIRGAQETNPAFMIDLPEEDATSEELAQIQSQLQLEQAVELRFVFALADFLKMQSVEGQTGLFDLA